MILLSLLTELNTSLQPAHTRRALCVLFGTAPGPLRRLVREMTLTGSCSLKKEPQRRCWHHSKRNLYELELKFNKSTIIVTTLVAANTEEETAGRHHRLNGRESGWTPGVGDGQGGLACCDSRGSKESDTTERLSWTEHFLSTCVVHRALCWVFHTRSSGDSSVQGGGGGLVTKPCRTLCDPMDCSPPGSSCPRDFQEYWSGLLFPSPGGRSPKAHAGHVTEDTQLVGVWVAAEMAKSRAPRRVLSLWTQDTVYCLTVAPAGLTVILTRGNRAHWIRRNCTILIIRFPIVFWQKGIHQSECKWKSRFVHWMSEENIPFQPFPL